METPLLTIAQRLTSFGSRFTPQPSRPVSRNPEDTKRAQMYKLFPKTYPAVDGEECMQDCESCTLSYPAKFIIDEEDELFGKLDQWDTYLIVATGKDDWIRDVADEQGSIMEAVGKGTTKPANGKMMLSASNIPVPDDAPLIEGEHSTTVLLLPAFILIDNVTPERIPTLINDYVNTSPTNAMSLHEAIPASLPSPSEDGPIALSSHPCPHRHIILLCSQKTRDARCGQSAPILRREFERHLRPLGLYRDLHDARPGGVGIYFISHVGGHRYSANVMVYRRSDAGSMGRTNGVADGNVASELGEAAQCIWLARVRPRDCENIVRYTVLQGKVVKPESQLRGGFNRVEELVRW